jgi:hypothetical protein
MNRRVLIGGLGILAILVGVGLVCFAFGGFFNPVHHSTEVGFGPFRISQPAGSSTDLTQPGPLAGCILMIMGAAGLVVAVALKRA